MCSVVGCDSWRRGALRFRLPEDPERRLEWVQFLFEVNGQRLRESSWTDITICREHFSEDCFVQRSAAAGTVQLKCGAVPSLCVKAEPEEPPESPQDAEPLSDVAYDCYDLKTCDSPASYSEKSFKGSHSSPEPSGVSTSCFTDVSNVVASGSQQSQTTMFALNKEKAALLQMKGKFVVNESCLLQLFRRKCPSCGCRLQMEKVTCGLLIVLNQKCLQCDYRYQWKSQVSASDPRAEGRGASTAPEIQQEIPTDDNLSSTCFSEIVIFSDEESDPSDEGEEGDEGSDVEWNPAEDSLLAEELTKESEEETEDEGEEDEDFDSPGGLKINELCTECGSFFNILKPHTCEHKVKPFSCNICGKRCVTETSLRTHSKIHDETYEHPCKYCHVTFKIRVDKLKHEQTHQDSKDPYRCPDCPQTFASSRERSAHLTNHRASREFKCGVCGIEFKDVHHLRRHSVVHTGLRPYKCSDCQRGFNQASHLKSHMRLHTGERPYKCQLCDKRFNHNVSLKSHVQRHHAQGPARERKRGKTNDKGRGSGGGGDEKGTGSEFHDTEEEEEEEEEEEVVHGKKRADVPKRRRSTGRPKGRPKRSSAGDLAQEGQKTGGRPNTHKTAKAREQELKKSRLSDEESQASHSDMSDDSAEEEEEEEEEVEVEEERETARKSTGRSRGRLRNASDADFDPEEETKKKRYSSQSSGKSSERGRPKKNRLKN